MKTERCSFVHEEASVDKIEVFFFIWFSIKKNFPMDPMNRKVDAINTISK